MKHLELVIKVLYFYFGHSTGRVFNKLIYIGFNVINISVEIINLYTHTHIETNNNVNSKQTKFELMLNMNSESFSLSSMKTAVTIFHYLNFKKILFVY